MLYITQFLIGLLLEFTVLHFFLDIEGLEAKELAVIVLAFNMVTHPLLIYVIPLIKINYILSLAISEIAVMAVEAYLLTLVFAKIPQRKALKASILANLASWQLAPFLVFAVHAVKGLIA
ncbi:MAG: hypothetical protein ABEK04_00210 [Candidatus Nanohalobium sp.]